MHALMSHQYMCVKLAGFLPFEMPNQKWESISSKFFLVSYQPPQKLYDSIWVDEDKQIYRI